MMIQSTTTLRASEVQEAVDRILVTGKITRADQKIFMNAFTSEEELTDLEQIQINWIFEGLRRGALRVVD